MKKKEKMHQNLHISDKLRNFAQHFENISFIINSNLIV